jgi:hypothetical protein
MQDTPNPQYDAISFYTDENGSGKFFVVAEDLGVVYDEYEIVRIIDPAGNVNPGVGGTIVMLAREDGHVGSLTFRGEQCGKK